MNSPPYSNKISIFPLIKNIIKIFYIIFIKLKKSLICFLPAYSRFQMQNRAKIYQPALNRLF